MLSKNVCKPNVVSTVSGSLTNKVSVDDNPMEIPEKISKMVREPNEVKAAYGFLTNKKQVDISNTEISKSLFPLL